MSASVSPPRTTRPASASWRSIVITWRSSAGSRPDVARRGSAATDRSAIPSPPKPVCAGRRRACPTRVSRVRRHLEFLEHLRDRPGADLAWWCPGAAAARPRSTSAWLTVSWPVHHVVLGHHADPDCAARRTRRGCRGPRSDTVPVGWDSWCRPPTRAQRRLACTRRADHRGQRARAARRTRCCSTASVRALDRPG